MSCGNLMHRTSWVLLIILIVAMANPAKSPPPNLSLTVNPPGGLNADSNITYTATVTGLGPGPASLTFTFPADNILISMTSPAPNSCTSPLGVSPPPLTVRCPLQGDGTVVIVVHPTATSPRNVSALLTQGSTDVSAQVSSTITEVGISDVEVSFVNNPNPGRVGQPLTYQIKVRNLGDDDARDVYLTLMLPAGVRLVSAPAGCTPTHWPRESPHVCLVCEVGHMGTLGGTNNSTCPSGNNSVACRDITVVPLSSGFHYATAGARLSTPDPALPNNSATARMWVNP